jgi:hypothetical protein
MFGGGCGTNPMVHEFVRIILSSLSEFDGLEITPALLDRADARVAALRRIQSELVGGHYG